MRALRILVVEDDAVVARLFADVLAGMVHAGCAIEATAAEAVAAAAQCRPDLMIVDVRFADRSGLSAVAEILQEGFAPHVFDGRDISSVQALRPRAVAVQKPFREGDLARAVERALAVSRGS
jgi:CheY-like chemotaxis protein